MESTVTQTIRLTAEEVTEAITAYAKKFAPRKSVSTSTEIVYDEVAEQHEAVVVFAREEGNARKD